MYGRKTIIFLQILRNVYKTALEIRGTIIVDKVLSDLLRRVIFTSIKKDRKKGCLLCVVAKKKILK